MYNHLVSSGDNVSDFFGWDNYHFGWTPEGIKNFLGIVLGCCATGFFISFGSKFWHDTLDLLLYTKNLKEKLADSNTYTPDTIEQFDEYIKTPKADIIQTAINQNVSVLKQSNVSAIMHGKFYKNGTLTDCITVHLKDSNIIALPKTVTAQLASGRQIAVDVDYIPNVATPKAHCSDGDTICLAGSSFFGTICCKLFNPNKKEYYLLTCSHVMTQGSSKNYGGFLKSPQQASPTGEWTWAMLTEDIDAALIKIDPITSFKYTNNNLPKDSRTLTANDLYKNITLIGQNKTERTGQIVSYQCPFPKDIQYQGDIVSIKNLIILSQVDNSGPTTIYKAISAEGDSGSLVYDEQNNPIAMVIAGDETQFTYAISLDLITKTTYTKII